MLPEKVKKEVTNALNELKEAKILLKVERLESGFNIKWDPEVIKKQTELMNGMFNKEKCNNCLRMFRCTLTSAAILSTGKPLSNNASKLLALLIQDQFGTVLKMALKQGSKDLNKKGTYIF